MEENTSGPSLMLFFLVYTKYYDSSFIIDNFLVFGTFGDNTKMLARIRVGGLLGVKQNEHTLLVFVWK